MPSSSPSTCNDAEICERRPLRSVTLEPSSRISIEIAMPTANQLCCCRQRIRNRKKIIRLGLLEFFLDRQIIKNHLDDCPYFVESEEISSSGIKTTLNTFLSKSIQIALNFSTSRSQSIIGLTLNFRSTRNVQSPAFERLQDWVNDKNRNSEDACALLLQIPRLFHQGEATPYDIGSWGMNLLQVWRFPSRYFYQGVADNQVGIFCFSSYGRR